METKHIGIKGVESTRAPPTFIGVFAPKQSVIFTKLLADSLTLLSFKASDAKRLHFKVFRATLV